MTWVDYRHIKASVPIEKVLAHYNIQLKQTAEHHLAGVCPIPSHNGDRSNKTAFHVDTQKNVFNCFTHCGGGNILDFVAKMEGCEIRKSADKLWIVDSTHLQANVDIFRASRKKPEAPAEKRQSPTTLPGSPDPDTRFGAKSKKKKFFGYKHHLAIDVEHDFITHSATSSGNMSDNDYFEDLLEGSSPKAVTGDKIYDI